MRSTLGRACVLTHGGVTNSLNVVDGCQAACTAARDALRRGESALDAAVAAVIVLEDDPRMNAGTGSVIRLDSPPDRLSAQMDASVMDTRGFGAVAVVEDIRNPVKLARAVYESPHRVLAGTGAMELADRLQHQRADPVTDEQRQRHEARVHRLRTDPVFQRMWSQLPTSYWKATAGEAPTDTVGAVVRDTHGNFAAASSTGGLWCAIRGRVGDVPIAGAGLWVGPRGAVTATGVGEVICEEMVSLRIHDLFSGERSTQSAVDEVVARVRERHPEADLGVIALDATTHATSATGPMPWATWVEDSDPI